MSADETYNASNNNRILITNHIEQEEFEDNRYDEDLNETNSETHGDDQFEKDFAENDEQKKPNINLFSLPRTPQKTQEIVQEEEEFPATDYSENLLLEQNLVLQKKRSKSFIKIPLLSIFLFIVFAMDAVSVHTVDTFMPKMLNSQFKISPVDIGLYMGFLGSAYYAASFLSHIYFGFAFY